MHHTQAELNQIWIDLKAGQYENSAPYIPITVVDDEVEQVLSVPIRDNTARVIYKRRSSKADWEVCQ